MRITEPASHAILQVMMKKGLDPKSYFLEIGLFDGSVGIGFTKNRHGKFAKFGLLGVVISDKIDTTGTVIDFGEVDGRKGLIFLGEEHVREQYREQHDHSDGTSNRGSQESDGGTGIHHG